jgi:hypothetical protein
MFDDDSGGSQHACADFAVAQRHWCVDSLAKRKTRTVGRSRIETARTGQNLRRLKRNWINSIARNFLTIDLAAVAIISSPIQPFEAPPHIVDFLAKSAFECHVTMGRRARPAFDERRECGP